MQKISYKNSELRYELSPYREPVARVRPGETVIVETQDASGGQISREGDVRDWMKLPFSNPVVGPLYVEGAEKGDTLSVVIREIKPLTGQGATWFGGIDQYLGGTSITRLTGGSVPKAAKICKIAEERISLMGGISLPYRPMIGTIGVAPHPELHSMSTVTNAGPHGGNLDLPDIAPGSKVFLPVFHDGALLYLGDAHAAQGDGEITEIAIEMSAEIRIKVDLVKSHDLEWPRVETDQELISIVTTTGGRALKEAKGEAFVQLSGWIEERCGLGQYDAFMLCGEAGRIRIGNLSTAAAKIEKNLLPPQDRATQLHHN